MTDVVLAPQAPVTDDADGAPGGEAVVVRLGSGRFAAELSAVAEVGRVPAVTRIPGGPGWLAGIANWRGRLLPVLDLRSLLGAEATPLEAGARLVVLTADGMSVGVLVDSVEGTSELGDVLEEFPPALADRGSGLLAGQVPAADGPIAVLDARAILRLREELPRVRRAR